MALDGLPPAYGVRHPQMLCTALKLDRAAICTAGGAGAHADFSEARCVCWAAGDAAPELLDGATGEAGGGAASRVCSARLRADFRALCAAARAARLAPASLPPPEAEAKAALEDGEYAAARELLYARGCFAEFGRRRKAVVSSRR